MLSKDPSEVRELYLHCTMLQHEKILEVVPHKLGLKLEAM